MPIEGQIEKIRENIQTIDKLIKIPVYIDVIVEKEVEVIIEKEVFVTVVNIVEVEIMVEVPVYVEKIIEEVVIETNVDKVFEDN